MSGMNLTASDRKALIRLASSLPKGSEERRAILAGLGSKRSSKDPARRAKDALDTLDELESDRLEVTGDVLDVLNEIKRGGTPSENPADRADSYFRKDLEDWLEVLRDQGRETVFADWRQELEDVQDLLHTAARGRLASLKKASGSPDEIEGEWRKLKKLDREELEAEYQRHHRVSRPSELSKEELVTDVLRARHGQRRLDEWVAKYP